MIGFGVSCFLDFLEARLFYENLDAFFEALGFF